MAIYMMRVQGLGEVHALFFPSAQTDDEARQDVHITLKSDKRAVLVQLYRIYKVDCANDPNPEKKECVYLITGISKDSGGAILNVFFYMNSDAAAARIATLHDWREMILYRCQPID